MTKFLAASLIFAGTVVIVAPVSAFIGGFLGATFAPFRTSEGIDFFGPVAVPDSPEGL